MVFAGLVVIGVWASTLTITTTEAGDAATLAVGAQPFVAGAYAAAWGIVRGRDRRVDLVRREGLAP